VHDLAKTVAVVLLSTLSHTLSLHCAKTVRVIYVYMGWPGLGLVCVNFRHKDCMRRRFGTLHSLLGLLTDILFECHARLGGVHVA